MLSRLLFSALTLFALTGCLGDSKSKKEKAAARAEAERKKNDATINQSNDVAFQSFLGRLRLAAEHHDKATLATMMIPGFGYRWDNAPPGEDVFTYWDQNNLWNELICVTRENWTPFEGYMVAPTSMPAAPDYRGYRAGLKQFQGSWRFAYFVSPQAVESLPPVPE